MKLECTKETLEHIVLIAGKISGRTLALPVLNCILLQARTNTLSVRATNLDIGVEMKLPVKIHDEGVCAVPGAVFSNTIAALRNDETVTLQSENDTLIVATKRGKTVIKTLPHDDFPTLPILDESNSCSFDAKTFVHGLQSVWYSASLSNVKPELGSVYVYNSDGKVFFVATDSFRLAEKTFAAKTPETFGPFLIPFRNIPEIVRVLEQAEKDIEIRWNENQLSFLFDKIYLTSRLIGGSFPDYRQIIPKEAETTAVILKQDLVTALKKSTIFSDTFNQIRFTVNPLKKQFAIFSHNADVGETKDSIDAALSGEAVEIAFNHKYITDCFQSIVTDSISLSFSGLARPMVIRGVGDPSFLYLVMPMNK